MPINLTALSHSLSDRIPPSVRRYWRTYGPLTVLLLSLLGLWLGDGERYIQRYVEHWAELGPATRQQLASSDSYVFGYVVAYMVLRIIYAPEQVIPWIGLVWSLAVLTYWLCFRVPQRWPQPKNWLSSPWMTLVMNAFFFRLDVPHALDRWAGRNDVNKSIATGIAVFCVGYCFWMYFREKRQVRRQLTETATQAELTALKAQINPHFLFNSLNNIFGTALTEGGQRTPAGVQQLSGLLRYQLEKTQQEWVDVLTELRFLDDYVQFHRQLLTGTSLSLTHHYEWDKRPATIAPLLLTPLIDYALQHQTGDDAAPLQSHLIVRDQFLRYQLTYPAQAIAPAPDALNNLQQRLEKLYPEKYTFRRAPGGQTSKLDLTILLTNS